MNSGDRCYERLLFIHETCWSSKIWWSLDDGYDDDDDDDDDVHLGGGEEEGARLSTLPLPQTPRIIFHLGKISIYNFVVLEVKGRSMPWLLEGLSYFPEWH